jgi:hypothetical protein
LVALETISGYPSGPSGKLDLIQNDKDISEVRLMEKTGIRRKIGLIGGEDRFIGH